MKTTKFFSMLALAIAGAACDEYVNEMPEPVAPRQEIILTDSTGTVLPAPTLRDIAKAISELPMRQEQLNEVYEAVSASSGNGYDEEYMMSDLFLAPGSGVGSDPAGRATKAVEYRTPLRDMLRDYFTAKFATKAGAADIEAYINSLIESDAQIYWPYSEDWDGRTYPIVTFDPGYGAESNYGYEIRFDASGARVVDSEFFIKCGSASGFKAETDDELRLYNPEVTDFMIVVKRKQVMEQVAVDAVLVTDFTPQIEKIAFMIIEDDGGTTTSWKCSASAKYQSKTYGFDLDLPYKDKDDIAWRGQLAAEYFQEGETTGKFGDVWVTFRLE